MTLATGPICRTRRWATLLALIGLSACGSPRPSTHLDARTLDGQVVHLSNLAGRPAVLLFWRSDCGPCLIELQNLAGLKAATSGGRLVAVALEEPVSARATVRTHDLPTDAVWTSPEETGVVLTRFGGPPPRLPLAVALDRQGRICATHHGTLGTDRARKWIQLCS